MASKKGKDKEKGAGKGKKEKTREINPRKVFVRGLPSNFNDKRFKKFFEEHVGEVSSAIVLVDKETMLSRGCGLLTFPSESVARMAVEQQPFFVKGKSLILRADGDNGDREEDPRLRLRVERLPWDFTDELLYNHFSIGDAKVESAKVLLDRDTGESTGRGFISFASRQHVKLALQKPQFVEGKILDVRRCDSNERKADSGHRLMVKGLPSKYNDEMLYKYITRNIGKTEYAQVVTDRETGESRGFGFGIFKESPKDLSTLKQGHFIDGRALELVLQGEEDDADGCTLFVRGLAPTVGDLELYDFFVAKCGACVKTAKVFRDRETGVSKGCGHVVFQSEDDAEAATWSSYFMNQKLLKTELRNRTRDSAGKHADDGDAGFKLFVRQLPWDAEDEELFDYFTSKYSDKVKDARVVKDRETGESKGFGFVTFITKVSAENAVKRPHYLRGQELVVRVEEKGEDGKGKGKSKRKGKDKDDSGERNRTLTVRGLPTDVTDEDLYEYFVGKGGTVESARIKWNRETQERTSMAFITLSSAEDAARMTRKSHAIKGKTVTVECDCDSDRRLFVRGLPYTIDDEVLRKYFTNCVGKVQSARIVVNEETGESRGFAIVVVADTDIVQVALNMPHAIDGRALEVSHDADRGKGKQEGKGKGKGKGHKGKKEGPTSDLPPLAFLRPDVYKKLNPDDRRIDSIISGGGEESNDWEDLWWADTAEQTADTAEQIAGNAKQKSNDWADLWADTAEHTADAAEQVAGSATQTADEEDDLEAKELVFSTPQQALEAQEALWSMQLSSVEVDADDACKLLVKGLPPGFDTEELTSLLATAEDDMEEHWAEEEADEQVADECEDDDWKAEVTGNVGDEEAEEQQAEEWEDDDWKAEATEKVADEEEWCEEEWCEELPQAVQEPSVNVKSSKRKESETQDQEPANQTSPKRRKPLDAVKVKSTLDDWIPMISKTHGGIYYYNSRTGQSKAANWKPMLSKSTGDIYFYNTATGESKSDC